MTKSRILAIGGGVAVTIIILVLIFVAVIPLSPPTPALVMIVDYDVVNPEEGGSIISGRVVNSGQTVSNPVILEIVISDLNKNILFTTTTAPSPSILQPGMEASFSKKITYEDIGGYVGEYYYKVEIISQ